MIFSIPTALSDTLIFHTTGPSELLGDRNWFNTNNWYTNGGGGNLVQAFRLPGTADRAEVSGIVEAAGPQIEVHGLTLGSRGQIIGGQFLIEELSLDSTSELTRLQLAVKTSLKTVGPGVVLDRVVLTVEPGATVRIESLEPFGGQWILSGGTVISNRGMIVLLEGAQLAGLASFAPRGEGMDRIEILPGSTLAAEGSAFISGLTGATPTLQIVNDGTVSVDVRNGLFFGKGIAWTGGTNGLFQTRYSNASNVFTAGLAVPPGVTFTIVGGAVIAGNSTLDGRLNVGGPAFGVSRNQPAFLRIDGSEDQVRIDGGGTLSIVDTDLTSGLEILGSISLSGPVINVRGGLALRGTGIKSIQNGTKINNLGFMSLWEGELQVGTDTAVNNFGSFYFRSNAVISGLGGTFTNAGTLRIEGTNAEMTLPFYNHGNVELSPGVLTLANGESTGPFSQSILRGEVRFGPGVFILNPGTKFPLYGTVTVAGGTLLLNTDVKLWNLGLEAGTLEAVGALSIGNRFNWTAGTLAGNGILYSSGLTVIEQNLARILSIRLCNNAGKVQQAGALLVGPHVILNNLPGGLWELQADSSLQTRGDSVFNNGGTFRKSTGAGTARIDLPFNNSGNVEILSGGVWFSGGFRQTEGSTFLAGATLVSDAVFLDGGVLTGEGTVRGDLLNEGIIAPSNHLTVTGRYMQTPQGELQVLLGNTPRLPLQVEQQTQLAGTLTVRLIEGVTPGAETREILSANSRSGKFMSLIGPDSASAGLFVPRYTVSRVDLAIANPLDLRIAKASTNNFLISFQPTPGFFYTVEYADSLSNRNWKLLAILSIQDLPLVTGQAIGPQRFYRIRVE